MHSTSPHDAGLLSQSSKEPPTSLALIPQGYKAPSTLPSRVTLTPLEQCKLLAAPHLEDKKITALNP